MSKAAISVLNSLLMEEITAAESYKRAVQKFPGLDIESELEELHIAHSKRAQKLKKRLRELGVTPADRPSKRAFLDLAWNGAAVEKELRVLLMFESVESNVLSSYQASLTDLDDMSLSLVQRELLPDEELTHNVIYTLKTGMDPLAKSA